MSDLNENLSVFAHSIVSGAEMPQEVNDGYQSYSADTALEVYRNNYRGNLHDALSGTYPVIEQLVGEAFFRLLTREFIAQYPSRSANLHRYGAELAEFVATFAPAQSVPYLADVAALEWVCHCAYFAEDAGALDVAALSQVPPEHYPDLIFISDPSCHVLRSQYPCTAIWHAHQPGAVSDFNIDLESGPASVLVSRVEDVVRVREISDADAEWLSGIKAGASLGQATVATLARHPDFDLQAALLAMTTQGVLTGFSHREAS